MAEHYTQENEGKVGTIGTYEEAVKAHHLATADPEPERDGTLTGKQHEEKYNLERAAFHEGDEAREKLSAGIPLETADESAPVERAVPAKPAAKR